MPNAKEKTKTTKATEPQVRVRMYRHGLGDCFLLRFPKDEGGTYNVLIDCGLISVAKEPKTIMEKVVADIADVCSNQIDLVIMTHEHWDHASGFSTQQAQDAFDKIPKIKEVWYAWTEDPTNDLGKKLRKERATKVNALQSAAVALRGSGSVLGAARAERVESILQFFGVEPAADLQALAIEGRGAASGKTRSAFDYLGKRRGVKVRYCYPKHPPATLSGVEGVRVYILGPPENEGLIKRSAPTKKGKEVYELASDAGIDDSLAMAFERMSNPLASDGGPDCPFETGLGIYPKNVMQRTPPKLAKLMFDSWDEPDLLWRQIEYDWTASAETLALNLDSHTNNTCLVVAFEFVKSGRVLLFAADAQVGNWLSWQDTKWDVRDGNERHTVTGTDLLRRTVFYKVGHHGSHNATLRAQGLEQMTSEDLVAFVPVFKEHAEKNRWLGMPFDPLMKRLGKKTGGRVVFSDSKAQTPSEKELCDLSNEQRDEFIASLAVDELFYEYSFAL